MIACTHPGKIGDALYALPAVRALCEKHGCKADFYTSEYVRPALELLNTQHFIRNAVIAEGYTPERADCGVQPWEMPVPAGYDAVYQLGFRGIPDRPLHEYIAAQAGLNGELRGVQYDFIDCQKMACPYLVLAARGETNYAGLFRRLIAVSPIPVVEVGAVGEYIGHGCSIDLTGLSMMDVMPWLAGARGFVGISSAMLVLANGFSMPKVVPHDGKSWDERHWVRSPSNHYLVDPDVAAILHELGLSAGRKRSYSKTYDPADNFEESATVQRTHEQLAGISHRFEHPLRSWEYGLTLNVLRENLCRNVLDVGGGGSVFAPAAASFGMQVTQVDPGDCSAWVAAQAERIGQPLAYHQCGLMEYDEPWRYDAVTCLSVLEHIENDMSFFRRLQAYVRPGGLLILTVDFWPGGAPHVNGHLRTYDSARIGKLVEQATGFELLGPPDYTDRGAHVYSYTFASLVMRKAKE